MHSEVKEVGVKVCTPKVFIVSCLKCVCVFFSLPYVYLFEISKFLSLWW